MTSKKKAETDDAILSLFMLAVEGVLTQHEIDSVILSALLASPGSFVASQDIGMLLLSFVVAKKQGTAALWTAMVVVNDFSSDGVDGLKRLGPIKEYEDKVIVVRWNKDTAEFAMRERRSVDSTPRPR